MTDQTRKLVLSAVMTAIVVIFQVMAVLTRAVMPVFSINLVLIPIVIGAAIGGVSIGGWLGFISGVAVLISGDAAAFWAVNIPGTIITVLLKGFLSGVAAAFVYKLLETKNRYFAVRASDRYGNESLPLALNEPTDLDIPLLNKGDKLTLPSTLEGQYIVILTLMGDEIHRTETTHPLFPHTLPTGIHYVYTLDQLGNETIIGIIVK